MNRLLIALLLGCAGAPAFAQIGSSAPNIPPGLYLSVTDGQIVLSNRGGTTNFSAGQFGYTASLTQPPVIVPKNPAIQFTPPPAFNTPTMSSTSATASKTSTVDCEVR